MCVCTRPSVVLALYVCVCLSTCMHPCHNCNACTHQKPTSTRDQLYMVTGPIDGRPILYNYSVTPEYNARGKVMIYHRPE